MQCAEPLIALQISGALGRFWHYNSHVSEGRRWLEAGLALDDTNDDVLLPWRARALNGAGALAWLQSDYAAALPLLEASLQLWQARGDQHQIATVLNLIGLVWRERGDVWACARRLRALPGHSPPPQRLSRHRDRADQPGRDGDV
ncbi:tetratricopeptide repeat protein, partial [Candidatus Gracilibacteria bacterium]|nr:tetratricopeptide repeat protein [Candidatus Gracilibacteria bacterium]